MSLRGVLIDFGYTLAYIDKEEDTNYGKEIVILLKKRGYGGSLDDFSPVLDDAYRNNRAGETKNMYEFWRSLLNNICVSESLPLIQELEKDKEALRRKDDSTLRWRTFRIVRTQ